MRPYRHLPAGRILIATPAAAAPVQFALTDCLWARQGLVVPVLAPGNGLPETGHYTPRQSSLLPVCPWGWSLPDPQQIPARLTESCSLLSSPEARRVERKRPDVLSRS